MGLYRCDPSKNIECDKSMCFIFGGPCRRTIRKECKMKLLRLFSKKKYATGGIVPPQIVGITDIVPQQVVGITAAEYNRIHDVLSEVYANAASRQKPTTKKPSGYMRGIKAALQIVESVEPHTMEVQ